jgi:hypothetical protein
MEYGVELLVAEARMEYVVTSNSFVAEARMEYVVASNSLLPRPVWSTG